MTKPIKKPSLILKPQTVEEVIDYLERLAQVETVLGHYEDAQHPAQLAIDLKKRLEGK